MNRHLLVVSAALLIVGAGALLSLPLSPEPGGRAPIAGGAHPDLPSGETVRTGASEPHLAARAGDGSRSPAGETEPQRRRPSGALQALQFWGAQRAYPNRTVPAASYGAALARDRQLRQQEATGADDRVAPWTALGPANIGGRTLCLALHPTDPNVLFAGSASGGLWKSTTGGIGADAWDYVDTGYPVLGVSTIAIDPTDPSVMYVGTGEAYDYDDAIGGEVVRTTRGSYGVGILKSSDGGATWSPSLDWTYQQSRGVWMIQIHPTDSAVLYAATTEGVYKSTDAGGNWTRVHSVIMAMDVRIHPTTPATVFAAHGNFGSAGHGIYRSTDSGSSWTRLTTGLPTSWTGKAQLAIAPTTPHIVFASIADEGAGRGLYKSTNTGGTWTRVNATDYPAYQGWYSHYVVVSPFDPQVLFTGGIEIWRSTDGGATLGVRSSWQSVFLGTSPPQGPIGGANYAHADHHFAVWSPTQPNTVYFASDGGVFRTTNLGVSFESLIGGYQTTQFYNGFSNSASDPNFAMGGLQDNFTAIYQGTNAWRRVIGGDGTWTAMNPLVGTTIYGSAQYLGLYRSRDAGNGWTSIAPPQLAGDVTPFVAPYVLCPGQPTVLYAGRSRVYRSDNEGTSWVATNGGSPLSSGNPVLSLAVGRTSPDTAYAGTAPIASRARVFRTRNGGGTWTDVTGALPDRYPSDLAVDPNDDRKAYVTFMGFGTSHVFRSADGGDSWTDIGAGLPDIPTSAIVVDPDHPEVIYVGTDLGIFLSVDSGASWEPFTAGMPRAMVNDLTVFLPERKIRAATHGNGAYERPLYEPCEGGDTDLDGVCDPVDCAPLDPQTWARPGEATELRVAKVAGDVASFSWSAPSEPGGAAVVYDTVSSLDPGDFVASASVACVEWDDGPNTTASDARLPESGAAIFYLVRAENACGLGAAGSGTSGVPRETIECPDRLVLPSPASPPPSR